MKKALLTFLLLAATTLFSQVKLRPGIRLAMNIANISGFEESSSKIGLNVGAFANIHLTSFHELQLELSYSNQGANINRDIIESYYDDNDSYIESIIQEDVREDLHYVSIGLMNKLFFKDTGLHFIVGPSLDVTHDSDGFFGGFFPTIDFALTGGLGYEFPFGLAVEARYKQGLIDLNDRITSFSNDSEENSGNLLNSVFQVGLSYKFDFKKINGFREFL